MYLTISNSAGLTEETACKTFSVIRVSYYLPKASYHSSLHSEKKLEALQQTDTRSVSESQAALCLVLLEAKIMIINYSYVTSCPKLYYEKHSREKEASDAPEQL